jgi:hypothetical protein
MVNKLDFNDGRYSLWEDIFHIISFFVDEGKEKYGVDKFTSPYIISCLDWFEKLGQAIQNNDEKKQDFYLYNIEHYTVEGLDYYSKNIHLLEDADNAARKLSENIMIAAMILRNQEKI